MPHAAALAHWLQQHFGWIPIFSVDADPNAAIWDASPLRRQRVLRRHRGRDDGDADGLRGDAPGLLPGAAWASARPPYALGATRWGVITVGRAALRPRRHHRRDDARARPGARRDHRGRPDRLAGLRDQAADPRDRHHHGQLADRRPLRRGQRRRSCRPCWPPASCCSSSPWSSTPAAAVVVNRSRSGADDVTPDDRPPTTYDTATPPSTVLPSYDDDAAPAGPAPSASAGRPPGRAVRPGRLLGWPVSALAWLITQRLLPLGRPAVVPRSSGSCSAWRDRGHGGR